MPKNADFEKPDERNSIGIYVNQLAIGHTMSEVLMEFSQVFDETVTSQQTRLITSPTHLRSFQALMTDAIERYEDEFGPLPNPAIPAQEH